MVWCGAQRCEERDGSGSLSNGKQFFGLGQVNFASGTPTNYFYTTDHLGSTREMTKTVSGTTTIEAQYGYDPYGIATKLQGSQDADFQYAGYYMHPRSGLNLPVFRAYPADLGRFINRDPIGESGGVNLYGYVGQNPLGYTDPSGLATCPDLAKKIVAVRNELAKRASDLILDPLGLPKSGPNSIEGHQHQFRCKQTQLRDLLNQYDSQGCGGPGGGGGANVSIPSDSRKYSTLPAPSPAPKPAPSPKVMPPEPEIPWWVWLGIRLAPLAPLLPAL